MYVSMSLSVVVWVCVVTDVVLQCLHVPKYRCTCIDVSYALCVEVLAMYLSTDVLIDVSKYRCTCVEVLYVLCRGTCDVPKYRCTCRIRYLQAVQGGTEWQWVISLTVYNDHDVRVDNNFKWLGSIIKCAFKYRDRSEKNVRLSYLTNLWLGQARSR